MSAVQHQVHSGFKAFYGTLGPNNGLGKLADEVAGWAKDSGVAAKSIGVEYLEGAGGLVLTIGYRDDEPGYPISLETMPLGVFEGLNASKLKALEEKMIEASRKVKNIICHELYVTDAHEFVMVFLTHHES